jgi:hypothetical protein
MGKIPGSRFKIPKINPKSKIEKNSKFKIQDSKFPYSSL